MDLNKKIIGITIICVIVIFGIIAAGLFLFLSNDTKKDNDANLQDNENITGTWVGNLDAKDQVYYDDIETVEIKKFVFSENTVTYDIYMNGIKEVVEGNYTISQDDSISEEQKGATGGLLFFEYYENGFVYYYVLYQGYLYINNAIFVRQ